MTVPKKLMLDPFGIGVGSFWHRVCIRFGLFLYMCVVYFYIFLYIYIYIYIWVTVYLPTPVFWRLWFVVCGFFGKSSDECPGCVVCGFFGKSWAVCPGCVVCGLWFFPEVSRTIQGSQPKTFPKNHKSWKSSFQVFPVTRFGETRPNRLVWYFRILS